MSVAARLIQRLTGRWRDQSLRRKTAAILMVPVIVVLLDCSALLLSAQYAAKADRDNRNSTRIQLAVNGLLLAMLNAETGIRGYLASGSVDFLQPYELALRDLPSMVQRLDASLTNPSEGSRLSRIGSLTSQELGELGELRDSRTGVQRLALLATGKATMDRLRAELGALGTAPLTTVARNEERASRYRSLALIVSVVSIPASAAGVVAAFALFSTALIRRIRAAEGKADQIAAGGGLGSVDGSRDEIGRLDEAIHRAARLLAEREEQRESAVVAATAATAEADSANAAKSEFLSRVSHELRTPLNAVLGFGQLLESDVTNDTDRDAVRRILRGGEHLLALINDLLDISAADSGQLRVELQSVDVGSLIAEAGALISPIAAQSEVLIDLTGVAGVTEYALVDPHRLMQILLNLMSNAVKYNRPNGAVTARISRPLPDRIRIQVRDTGIGIEAGKLRQLFTPFDRLGAERLKIAGGGLGLSVAKRLTEAMGGQIGVQTVVGTGSTFWLEFPAGTEPAAPPVGATWPVRDSHENPVILCIEDNLANLALLERAVGSDRSAVLIPAQLGRLGLALAREHQPDLILLDLRLPDLGGVEVFRQLRAEPRTATIPVVILTADARPQEREVLLAAGAFAYLTKPLRLPVLLETIDRALRRPARPVL